MEKKRERLDKRNPIWIKILTNGCPPRRSMPKLLSIAVCLVAFGTPNFVGPSSAQDLAPYHSVIPDALKTTYYRPGNPRDDRDNMQDPARLKEFWASLKEGPDVKTAALKTLSHFGGQLPIHFYGPDPQRPAKTEHIVVWDVGVRSDDEVQGILRGYVHLTVMQPMTDNPQRYVAFSVSGKTEDAAH